VDQAQIVQALNAGDARNNLLLRHRGFLDRLGLGHGHTFKHLLGQEFLLSGRAHDRARVRVAVARTTDCGTTMC
jgi:hypothetical protein